MNDGFVVPHIRLRNLSQPQMHINQNKIRFSSTSIECTCFSVHWTIQCVLHCVEVAVCEFFALLISNMLVMSMIWYDEAASSRRFISFQSTVVICMLPFNSIGLVLIFYLFNRNSTAADNNNNGINRNKSIKCGFSLQNKSFWISCGGLRLRHPTANKWQISFYSLIWKKLCWYHHAFSTFSFNCRFDPFCREHATANVCVCEALRPRETIVSLLVYVYRILYYLCWVLHDIHTLSARMHTLQRLMVDHSAGTVQVFLTCGCACVCVFVWVSTCVCDGLFVCISVSRCKSSVLFSFSFSGFHLRNARVCICERQMGVYPNKIHTW